RDKHSVTQIPKSFKNKCFCFIRAAQCTLITLAALWLSACTSVFFYPDDDMRHTPTDVGLAYREVMMAGQAGQLHGWWLPAVQGEAEALGTLVYAHGNAGNMVEHFTAVSWLPEQGYNVLMFDYRGYGYSEGEPSPKGIARDTLRAVEWARAYLSGLGDAVAQRGVMLYGHSLGGAAAAVAAAHVPRTEQGKVPFKALLLDSTFASYQSMAKAKVRGQWLTAWLSPLVPLLVSGEVPTVNALPRLQGLPLWVVHSESDRIVPFEQGRQVFEAALEPKQFHTLATDRHNHGWQHQEDRAWLLELLNRIFSHPDDTDALG
ncbi:lipoprotein, partial [gamma proteobacterium HTCC5015]